MVSGSPKRFHAGPGAVGACVILVALILLGPPPSPAVARGRIFVANCGVPGFLEVKPDLWSAGCTSGSPSIESLRWLRYGARGAVAEGVALVQNCGCYDPTEVARYPARIVLSRLGRCPDHRRWRYFFAARLTITYPEGNPFGEPAGNVTATFHPLRGECGLGSG
jgi:hypothetical protein